MLQPTLTVTITFAASVLPEYLDIGGWRHNVTPYIPPVKQCYRCLRYGHLAKFCKNSERCSICKGEHNYKTCTTGMENAICVHCNGNHTSVSPQCPVKQKKIAENRSKFRPASFGDILSTEIFPKLGNKPKKNVDLISILNSDNKSLSLLIESIIKLISLHNTKNTSINTKSVLNVLYDTFGNRPISQNSIETN